MNIREVCPNSARKKEERKRKKPGSESGSIGGVGIARIGSEQRVEITGVPRRNIKIASDKSRETIRFSTIIKRGIKRGDEMYIRFDPFLSDEIIGQAFLIFIPRNYWNYCNVGIFTNQLRRSSFLEKELIKKKKIRERFGSSDSSKFHIEQSSPIFPLNSFPRENVIFPFRRQPLSPRPSRNNRLESGRIPRYTQFTSVHTYRVTLLTFPTASR